MKGPLHSTRHNLRLLITYALSNGWKVSRTQGGHIRFTKDGLPPIFTSATASDHRAELNAKAYLRRADRQLSDLNQESI